MNGLRETQLADGEAIFVAGAGMAGTCGMGDTGLHQAPELPEPAHTGGHAMGEGSQGAGSEESSFCGYVIQTLDLGFKATQASAVDEMRWLMTLISHYGAQSRVRGTGEEVQHAFSEIKNELKHWRRV